MVFTDIEIETARAFVKEQIFQDDSTMLIFKIRCHPDMPFKEHASALYGFALHFKIVKPSTIDKLLSCIETVEILSPTSLIENSEHSESAHVKMLSDRARRSVEFIKSRYLS